MHLDWTLNRVRGVALVAVRLRNDADLDREVRLRNELDGPVLPPRREGVFEAGWNREGLTVVVERGACEAVGYACPAGAQEPAGGPPVSIASVGAPGTTERGENARSTAASSEASGVDPATARAVRALGDPRPPRAVVDGGRTASGRRDDGAIRDEDDEDDGPIRDEDEAESDEDMAGFEGGTSPGFDPTLSARWIETVRAGVEVLESLEDASVSEAATVLDEHGGLDGVESLAADLAAAESPLRAVADDEDELTDRARDPKALADRVAAVDPPTAALRRLA